MTFGLARARFKSFCLATFCGFVHLGRRALLCEGGIRILCLIASLCVLYRGMVLYDSTNGQPTFLGCDGFSKMQRDLRLA